jgi:hypothetical protein
LKHSRLKRPALVGAVCAALAAGGIVATAAARSGHSTRHSTSSTTAATAPHDGPHGGFAVHAEEVVLNKAGTAFITQTEDNGTVSSVTGDQLAIKEGTQTVTYKTVTLTIPSGAAVYRNGAKATLADLKTGDHVRVSQSSDGTTVVAGDKTFGPGREHGPGRRGGPPPAGAPGYGG